MDATQLASLAGQVGSAVLAVVVSALVPQLLAILRDERNRRAIALVSRAGLIASSAALKAMHDALDLAKMPSSDGGKLVTPDERKAILRAGVDAGWRVVRDESPALLDAVLKIYGGEQAVRDSLEVIVRGKLQEVR